MLASSSPLSRLLNLTGSAKLWTQSKTTVLWFPRAALSSLLWRKLLPMKPSVVLLLTELSHWTNTNTSDLFKTQKKSVWCREMNQFIITNSLMMSPLTSPSIAGAWPRTAQRPSLILEITYGPVSTHSTESTPPSSGPSILETEWETTTFLSWFEVKIYIELNDSY